MNFELDLKAGDFVTFKVTPLQTVEYLLSCGIKADKLYVIEGEDEDGDIYFFDEVNEMNYAADPHGTLKATLLPI